MHSLICCKKGVLYLLVLRAHGGTVVVRGRSLHRHIRLHRRGRHVGCIRHRWNERWASGRLRRIGVRHVSRLRLEGGGHASALSRAVSELVGRRISHLLIIEVIMRGETSTTTGLGLEVRSIRVITLNRVARLASEVRSRLRAQGVGVGNRALSHVALEEKKKISI